MEALLPASALWSDRSAPQEETVVVAQVGPGTQLCVQELVLPVRIEETARGIAAKRIPCEMTDCGPTPSNNPGVLKWYINPETCLAFWRKNGTSCSNCIRSCPFNKAPGRIHDLARACIRIRSRIIDRAMVWMDDLCGYGSAQDARRALDALRGVY